MHLKLRHFIFIIFSCFLAWSCKQEDPGNKQLIRYLENTHALSPNDSSIYCFFPANQCKNCFLYNARFISPELNRHVIIITEFDSTNFKGFKNFYRDVNNVMIQLAVLDYGNRIITFKNGAIKHAVAVKDLYAQLDSISKNMALSNMPSGMAYGQLDNDPYHKKGQSFQQNLPIGVGFSSR
jgi:hypothetical protein